MSRFCAFALIVVVSAQAALATNYTFTSTTSNLRWNVPTAWTPNGYPSTFNDTAIIPGVATAFTVNSDTLGSNPILLSSLTLGTATTATRAGAVSIGNGTFNCPGFEFPDGGVITEYCNALDKIYGSITADGQLTVNIPTVAQYTNLYFDGTINGPGSVIKDGLGSMLYNCNVPNTYTGQTWVKSGRLYLSGSAGMQYIGSGGLKMTGTGRIQWNSNDHILDTAPIEMGDSANLALPAGMSEAMGAFTLDSGNPVIWGAAGSTYRFADSTAATWATDGTLTLETYNSSLFPTVYFGTNSSGLTAAQLSHIKFTDTTTGLTYPVGFDASNTGLLVAITHTYWSADFNHDFVVSFKDYIILEGNFGKSGATNAMGDADGDGLVTFKDYIALESQFNKTSSPEPATIGLLVAGGLALLRRKA